MDKLRILLADDDAVFCMLVGELLSQNGFEVVQAMDTSEAQKALKQGTFDILMQDLCFPALRDGFAMLDEAHEAFPKLEILMISGSGNIADAVRALNSGAKDFIEKPIEPEHLLWRIKTLSDRIVKERQLHLMEHTAIGMVGISTDMLRVFDSIVAAAKYDSPVLITGETGVGKELAARAVHRLSKQGDKNLVCINCASIPKELFEAELFGYEKGAFTGAINSYKGYFEFAQNASIFLDEIGELPLTVQAKLLRMLSEGEIQPLGGKVGKIETRIISASNQDLATLIKEGSFREDLFYRLNSIHIQIPPLRQRKEDIPLLARHFLIEFCQRHQLLPKDFSPRCLAWLAEQTWKGNGRELKNSIERAMIFAQGESLEVDDFSLVNPEHEEAGEHSGTLRESLREFETQLIKSHLRANNYNLSQTAKMLGIDKSNLSKRMHALGLNLHD